MRSRLAKMAALVVGLGAVAGTALATDPTPVDMASITLPVTTSSVVSAVFVAAGGALAACAVLMIGFKIVRRVISRLGKTG